MRRTPRLMTAALALAAVLVGCTPQAPAPTVRPTVEAPVYASEEEALAAAEAAYSAFLETSDAIIRDGGANAERLEPFISVEIYERELVGFAKQQELGFRGVGSTTFTATLQQFGSESITAYICEDLSGTDMVDATGTSVVKDGHSVRRAYEVEFDVDDALRITRLDPWDGGGVC